VASWLEARGIHVIHLRATSRSESPLAARVGYLLESLPEIYGAIAHGACSVWVRRLVTTNDDVNLPLSAQDICSAESREITGGLLACIMREADGLRVVDPHGAMELAQYKLLQLHVALKVGASIPDTLITNDPRSARQFSGEMPAVVKPLAEHRRLRPYVTRLPAEHISAVQSSPVVLQQEIDAIADVRLLVCGTTVLGWRRDRLDGEMPDWRLGDPHGKGFYPTELPPELCRDAAAIVSMLGLSTSVQDWLIDTVGKAWFLESNPQGAWLFLKDAHEIALPIFGGHLIQAGA
jgi:hypothetical protein